MIPFFLMICHDLNIFQRSVSVGFGQLCSAGRILKKKKIQLIKWIKTEKCFCFCSLKKSAYKFYFDAFAF